VADSDRRRPLGHELREIVELGVGRDNMAVYNLTVDGLQTYFVGEACVWVHNAKQTTSDDPPPDDDEDTDDADDDSDDDSSTDDSDSSTGGGSTSGGGTAPPPA